MLVYSQLCYSTYTPTALLCCLYLGEIANKGFAPTIIELIIELKCLLGNLIRSLQFVSFLRLHYKKKFPLNNKQKNWSESRPPG